MQWAKVGMYIYGLISNAEPVQSTFNYLSDPFWLCECEYYI